MLRAESKRSQAQASSCPLQWGCVDRAQFSQQRHVTRYCQPGMVTQALVQGFCCHWITEAWSTRVTGFNCSVTTPEIKERQHGPGEHKQAFTINHVVSINCLRGPKTSSTQRHTYQIGCAKGLEVISQKQVKGHCRLWNRQGLNTPTPLS